MYLWPQFCIEHGAKIQNICNSTKKNSEKMNQFEQILSKDEINSRFSMAVNAVLSRGLIPTKAGLAEALGVKPAKFSEILNGRMNAGTDILARMCDLFNVSPDWLMMGRGDKVFRDSKPPKYWIDDGDLDTTPLSEKKSANIAAKSSSLGVVATKDTAGAIPLVSEKAVGGFANEHFKIKEKDVLAYYVVPSFRFLGVDFMIEVIGDSMVPRLCPGDIIACSIIRNSKFMQWNKCHLIATGEQGIIVKRLMPGDHEDELKAISDNKDYPPFAIPTDEITGIARVVGVIHLE